VESIRKRKEVADIKKVIVGFWKRERKKYGKSF